LAGKVSGVGKNAAKVSVAGKVGTSTMKFFRNRKTTTKAEG
jgi:hypothetical protein